MQTFEEQFEETFLFVRSIVESKQFSFFIFGFALFFASFFFIYLGFIGKSNSLQIFYFTVGVLMFFFALIFIIIAYLKKFPQLKSKKVILQYEQNLNDDIEIRKEENSIEYQFKKLFRDEICFIRFKEEAIKNGFMNHNFKWLFKEKEILYCALLFFKLKEHDYFIEKIENRIFCEVASSLMGINLNPTMLSKYNPGKENNKHIKVDHLNYYNQEYSIFTKNNLISIQSDSIEQLELN